MTRVILGLGSNLGNRAQNLERAIVALQECLTDVRLSTIWESAAVVPDGAPQDWSLPFYNMAISGNTQLNPQALLAVCKKTEQTLGRKNRDRWAPREIDIDILTYGEEITQTDDLSVPHPYLLQRDFALLPLAELWPDWTYPGVGEFHGQTSAAIVSRLGYKEHAGLRKAGVTLRAA